MKGSIKIVAVLVAANTLLGLTAAPAMATKGDFTNTHQFRHFARVLEQPGGISFDAGFGSRSEQIKIVLPALSNDLSAKSDHPTCRCSRPKLRKVPQ